MHACHILFYSIPFHFVVLSCTFNLCDNGSSCGILKFKTFMEPCLLCASVSVEIQDMAEPLEDSSMSLAVDKFWLVLPSAFK